jgi:hypothetical protein
MRLRSGALLLASSLVVVTCGGVANTDLDRYEGGADSPYDAGFIEAGGGSDSSLGEASSGDDAANADGPVGDDAPSGDDASAGDDASGGDDVSVGDDASGGGDDVSVGDEASSGDDVSVGDDASSGDDASTGGDGASGDDGGTGDDATGGDGSSLFFPCGPMLRCDRRTQYCLVQESGLPGGATTYHCEARPACPLQNACVCIRRAVTCKCADNGGDVTETCGGV